MIPVDIIAKIEMINNILTSLERLKETQSNCCRIILNQRIQYYKSELIFLETELSKL